MNKHFYTVAMLIVFLTSILAAGLNISRVAAQPVVDGVISPGEYAGAMPITLVGPYPPGAPFPSQTVDAYIEWDTQYLWVAVNEPVPNYPTGGTNNWIEFCMDAGPWRPNLDAFVLFGNGVLQYVACPKPVGSWGWASSPFPWFAATNTATEFQIKYTDYGITFGDTIKMVIDRGKDDFLNPPFGDAVIWPSNPTFYPSVTTTDLATWGDVTLDSAPPPPTHVVDGVIGAGEYDGGMSVTLVGRTDSTWTVGGLIDWDSQYLYVAVNEPVPPGTGTQSWIEFAFDAGPSRSYLDAFVLFCSGSKTHVQCPKPPGSWSTVSWPYPWWAATGAATEFKFDYTDFGISLGDTIKMAIDRNDGTASTPPPHYIYGFAAFWPAGADVYSSPPDPSTWGDVYLAPPPPPSVSLTVVSAYDSPSPSGTTSYTPGTSVTASVTSPVAGAPGYRYVCTGWTGTGDVPSSGTGTTVTFTINQDSGITWNWKTQTYLTVKTDPLGIATIPGEGWYDKSTTVTLTAPPVSGYVFSYWDVNGISQGSGVNPISVQVDCTATAHYTSAPPPPPPPPVGGVWVPINKFELLAPYIGLVSVIVSAVAASGVIVKRIKKKQT